MRACTNAPLISFNATLTGLVDAQVAGRYKGSFPSSIELGGLEKGAVKPYQKVVEVTNPTDQNCPLPIDLVRALSAAW
jgi:hypothetical protein